ncbi:hypothetical protein PR202_ga24898 [Eleusine coracana subsp. coracana]|uniref:DUF309 domain-containing protein n=1 Tax=Eleusine coracana subsp. coracana TaxID=191504 RepID=A0AAV5D9Y9_ELECO|nr:hypothetical protein QOZ80_9AG0673280 [Eleusine coracana subsp. coracana]GJN07102.1 hypothetical protein PR202_ga24898 [Eleusine coracana subsp. coracana]
MAMLPSSGGGSAMCARPAALTTLLLRPGTGSPPPLQHHLHKSSSSQPPLLRRLGRARGRADLLRCRRRLMTARGEVGPPRDDDEKEEEDDDELMAAGFDEAVALFNRGEFHACHDVVEELWHDAEDPARTLLHGILQCAVGFHHLFNQNHRGAMMELGEGLCKLHKLQLGEDDAEPFSAFRDEVAAVLHFLYCTQKELAACTDEFCLTMDGSPSSYQLLGNFAAGQQLYRLEADADGASNIIFSASSDRAPQPVPLRVKVPTLRATEQHLTRLQCTYEYM